MPILHRSILLSCLLLLLGLAPTTTAPTIPAPSTPPNTQPTSRHLTISPDGTGDFRTLNGALAAIPDNSPVRTILHLRPGRYPGQILIPKSKPNLTLLGDPAGGTVLTYDLNVNDPYPDTVSRIHRGCGVVVQADNFHSQHITFENTSGDHGQAIALRLEGDRAVLRDCRLLGWQDTLMTYAGRHYFLNCYIEGRVDFIYGSATAVFDHCHLHSKNGGYITAASTPKDAEFGYVFLDCNLTGDDTPWLPPPTSAPSTQPRQPDKRTFLGRPWRPHAAVAFLRCQLGDHIRPEGWDNWRNPNNEKTARYAEYKNTGPGANPAFRVPWSRQLTDEEAARYTIANVLKGTDGWNPAEE